MKKIPVAGFFVTCLKCKGMSVKIEARQDGTDFICKKCGNKLLLRPGEAIFIQFPEQNIKQAEDKFEKEMGKPLDDWPNDVLDEWFNKQHGAN